MHGSVEAALNYLGPMQERPISHSGYPQLENLQYDARSISIAPAQRGADGPSLRSHGFAALPHATAIDTFDLSDRWHDRFRDEVADLIKAHTGAREVVIPAVSFRSTTLGGSFGPAHFCHNDYTPGSTARHITSLDPDKAEQRLARRFAAYNVWRLVSPPPQNLPLALCDARSVAASDFIPGEARFGGPEATSVWGEIACFRYNPAHRWFYYPDLGNAEILIWCGYDSDPAFPSIVPHSAFVDPGCPADAGPRSNVEGRGYAFF